MYQCVIIDDEYYARQRVMRCIDWKAAGFTLREAASSAEALALLEDAPADLAVVDITMPGENGLAFIARATGLYPVMRFIVLSGYSEFEYARQALRYGVEDYLTKPVNSGEMEQAAARARGALLRQESQASDAYWRAFFYGSRPVAPEDEALFQAGAGIAPQEHYAVLMCDFPTEGGLPHAQRRTAIEAAQAVIDAKLPPGAQRVQATDAFLHRILVLEDGPGVLEALQAAAQEIIRSEERPFYIGKSEPQPGTAGGLLTGYRQAEQAFLSKVLHPAPGGVLAYQKSQADAPAWQKVNQNIEVCLRTGDAARLDGELDALFGLIARALPDIQVLEAELTRLLALAKAAALAAQADRRPPGDRLTLMGCRDLIAQCDSLASLKARFKALMLPLAEPAQGGGNAPARLARRAVALMEENFRYYGFGLEMLSAKLLVSPAYLSNLFKKEIGSTVMQYVNRLRMEEARALLEAGALSVQQVADEVGYNDVFYFSKAFKKHFGTSPAKYRDQACR